MTQALHLMNASKIQKRISADGSRSHILADSDLAPAAIISQLYLTVFNRHPDASELEALESEFQSLPKENLKAERRKLIEDLLWSMVNSPEFLYLD
jgi:hypothetical protein